VGGLSQAQIAGQLRNPDSPVAKAIDGSANVIIAATDKRPAPPTEQLTSGGHR
jgi:hypothetical protein